MEEPHSDTPEYQSRRTFVKYAAGSLAASTALASLACSQTQDENRSPQPGAATPAPATTSATGPQKSDCCPPGAGSESDLPPVILGGYESVRIEIEKPLKLTNAAPPFTYTHADPTGTTPGPGPTKRYGNLLEVRVITERTTIPYVTDVRYFGLPAGSQLFVWYQPITTSPSTPNNSDCGFQEPNFPPDDPDVRVKGGTGGANPFQITVKHQRLMDTPIPTHKCARPHRYKHRGIPGLGRHFRIGQWRIVNSAGAIVSAGFEGSGDDDYTLFLLFDHA